MATDKVNLRQTAVNAATSIIAATIGAGLGQFSQEAFESLRNSIYDDLSAIQDANPTSYKGKGSKKSDGPLVLETVLKEKVGFGAFKELTYEDLLALDASTAETSYGYKNGDGRDYLTWMATKSTSRDGKPRAQLIIESLKESVATSTGSGAEELHL